MAYTGAEQLFPYQATRVELRTEALFAALVARLEELVPELTDAGAAARLAEDGDWATFTRGLAWEAPSGFVRLWSSRPDALMASAGSGTPTAVYLLANHAIGARLFRHDPATLLNAPLRLVLHAAAGAGTVVVFERPSDALRSFGLNKVTQAGSELDRALGDLLEELGLPRPAALRR